MGRRSGGGAQVLIEAIRSRPVAAGVVIVAAAAIAFAIARVAFPAEETLFTQVEASAEETAGSDGSSEEGSIVEAATVFVHVSGCVAQPGLRELAEGSRVADAIEAAGGFAEGASADSVNLARVVQDGEQIHVPSVEDEAPAGAGGQAASAGGKVNINLATAAELDAVTGIGPSTAEKIIADREANGPFSTIEDLMRVSGIGEKKFEAMRDEITV